MPASLADANSRLSRTISLYVKQLRSQGLTEKWVMHQDRLLRLFGKHCREHGVHAPTLISPELVKEWILRFDNMSKSYQNQVLVTLRTYLRFIKNPAYMNMKVRLVGRGRQRVDWLTPSETEEILGVPMTALEALVIRAGLLQGLRRIETLRMTVEDARRAMETGALSVKGKGGKNRVIPLHKGFAEAIRAYLDRLPDAGREDMLIPLSEGWVAEIVVRFSLRFGRRFTTHTLRRTFGRNLWLRGIPIETISELMGHSSTDTTRLYLGLNISDMRKAISEYGTKSELRILEELPQRRIAPSREKDREDAEDLPQQAAAPL